MIIQTPFIFLFFISIATAPSLDSSENSFETFWSSEASKESKESRESEEGGSSAQLSKEKGDGGSNEEPPLQAYYEDHDELLLLSEVASMAYYPPPPQRLPEMIPEVPMVVGSGREKMMAAANIEIQMSRGMKKKKGKKKKMKKKKKKKKKKKGCKIKVAGHIDMKKGYIKFQKCSPQEFLMNVFPHLSMFMGNDEDRAATSSKGGWGR